HSRKKDGKEHRYYSVEDSRRLQSGKVVQRRVLYLGEINDSQQAAWRKTLEVFDEQQRATTLRLFPQDRPAPADALDTIQVKLSETSGAAHQSAQAGGTREALTVPHGVLRGERCPVQ